MVSVVLVFLVGPAFGSAELRAERVHFNRDIRPLLSRSCFACHGPDATHREAELRFDVEQEAKADRGGYFALLPGKPDESELLLRALETDENLRMPPAEAGEPLTEQELDLVRRWIEQGAEYTEHWAFVAPQRPPVPQVEGSPDLAPIDAFIRAAPAWQGREPSPRADRATLIRRLSFDLTGLPPTAEEVAAFVADDSPDAYARLVDRLLESPHFGERMALDWLDAARYADTNGFSIDGGRHMWLWRDWVIDAFNRNLPYDQFLLEQLAGDLLPDRGEAQLIASGFQRNNMVTHEGGTIPAENLANYNADRVQTLGESMLGLSLNCAQCHDHKYDPISQRDYYQLFAYFNTLSDRGLDGDRGTNPAPAVGARTVLKTGEEDALRERIAELQALLDAPSAELVEAWVAEQRADLERAGRDLELHPVELLLVSTPNRGSGFDIQAAEGDRPLMVALNEALSDAIDVSLRLPPLDRPITGLRYRFHRLPDPESGNWGFGREGGFRLGRVDSSVDVAPTDQVNLHRLVAPLRATAANWSEGFPPQAVHDPRLGAAWVPDPGVPGPTHLTVTWKEPVDARRTPYVTTQLFSGTWQNETPRRIEILAMTGHDDGSPLPEAMQRIVALEPKDRSDEHAALLHAYVAEHAPALERTRIESANLKDRLEALTGQHPVMVMDVAPQPRETFILLRGDYTQPGERVAPGTPAFLPALPESDRDGTRLALARWVVMPDNPLTARVAVNRLWRLMFGTGIVATPGDFGAQGEWPSHPELLDWLAVEFVERDWDVKEFLRMLALSETYRQSSVADAESLAFDPENRLLGRGPRFRLPAEHIRDNALRVSGLLVPRLGGPSVHPYQPGDLWREISHYGSTPATSQNFVQDRGEKLYRRSLYTYWKRTLPPPNMAAFDAPSREVCTVSRPVTNTPLQALVLLNDVQFVEAARAFAERMLARDEQDAARLEWAFTETLSRPPAAEELQVLSAALARERARYRERPDAAGEYLAVGESPRDERFDPVEHAAWAQVASLLLNLSETITRN